MDPPLAVMIASPHSAPVSSSSSASIDRLMLFDAYGVESFTPLASSATSGSLPAHDALMAFLAEMEALDHDDEQQSETSSSTTKTVAVDAIADEELPPDADKESAIAIKHESVVIAQPTANAPAQKPTHVVESVMSEPKPGKKKRIRAKQEIDMLREDAEALQRQLEILQAIAPPKVPSVAGETSDTTAVGKSKKPKLRHVGAVEQNRQLRKLVKTQQRYSKQIENVLMGNVLDNEASTILISDTAITQTPLSKADLVVFYEALTGSLDRLYAQLDGVFTDAYGPEQTQILKQFSDAKVIVDDHKNVTVQLRDVKTVPFNFDTVRDSMIKILKQQAVQEGDGADEFLGGDSDVTLMRRGLLVQLDESDEQVEIPTRAVSKRFLSKDRMVFCWDGMTDWPPPPQMAESSTQNIPLREKGWAVLKAVPGTPNLCTIQMCLLMNPGLSDATMLDMFTREDIEDGLGRVIVPTYQQAFISRYQMLENMLMDEQFKR